MIPDRPMTVGVTPRKAETPEEDIFTPKARVTWRVRARSLPPHSPHPRVGAVSVAGGPSGPQLRVTRTRKGRRSFLPALVM